MKVKLKLKQIVKRSKIWIMDVIIPYGFYFSCKGFCPCCDKEVIFVATHSWLRDSLTCQNCYSKPRERALMLTIEKYYPNWRELRIHEAAPISRGASLKLKENAKKYIPTQYYTNKPIGKIINNFRNEDLENQSLLFEEL